MKAAFSTGFSRFASLRKLLMISAGSFAFSEKSSAVTPFSEWKHSGISV